MRRSLILSTFLTVAAAALGACQPQTNEPQARPPATPTPAATSSPVAIPPASPGTNVPSDNSKNEAGKDKKDVKPAATEMPKANK
jgi:hypothetical protein